MILCLRRSFAARNNPGRLLGLLLLPLALAGCQSAPRLALDTTAAAAGSIVANKASQGNPYWTAAGGLVSYAVTDAAQSLQDKNHQQELALAFERGRTQSAQQAYDAIQNAQKSDRFSPRPAGDSTAYTEIPIVVPARTINGVILNQTVEYLRISTK
ncbi:MAG: hypothetical protein ACHQ5A_10445 [Opitutales bacterium]